MKVSKIFRGNFHSIWSKHREISLTPLRECGVKVRVLQEQAGNPELEEVQPQPLDMSVPTDSFRAAVTYFVLLPIVFPLWLTLPDTRKHSCE